MKFEIEIPDTEINEAIRRGGMSALTSQKMKTFILNCQDEKIATIISGMDVSALVKYEIDETMKHVIRDGVNGRIRRVIAPIIEQEIAKLRAEATLTVEKRIGP